MDASPPGEGSEFPHKRLSAVLIAVRRRIGLQIHQEVEALEVIHRGQREGVRAPRELCRDGAEGRDGGGYPPVADSGEARHFVAFQTF